MSRKPTNVPIFLSASLSTSAPTYSAPLNVQHFDGFAVQLTVDALPSVTASVKLQGSCDPEIKGTAANFVPNWSDLTGSHRNVAFAGSGNSVFWTWDHAYFTHLRVAITTTAGSGSIGLGRFNGKG